MMKKIPLILLMLLPFFGISQRPIPSKFKLPLEATPSSYTEGVVLVKTNKRGKFQFESAGAGNRTAPVHPAISGVAPIIPKEMINAANARSRPGGASSDVDLTDYYTITFQGVDIETFINELYATGMVDIAEPDYIHHMHYTPNDLEIGLQYYLDAIKAYDAWDISRSDESIVIAIIDSGGDLDHPDLVDQLFKNEAELNGLPGVDDDGNGFIDDVNGWDFSGAEFRQINTPGFLGDNDPSIKMGGSHSHGTQAAGCAAATPDNGIGIAGVGFNAKLLFTKHFADDQLENSTSYTSDLYRGMLYAAAMGAKIINCSFGSFFRSQIRQNIVKAITLDYGCLVVASAGNADNERFSYPASYDYVLSVAATNESDIKSNFSTYNFKVDVSAPGSAIFTTTYDNIYGFTNGTSFSAPIVSGAAALVWSQFPELSPVQLAEQLRVSADESIYAKNSVSYRNRMGKGRLDIQKALTIKSPSIEVSNPRLVNQNGTTAVPGQTASLFVDFQNLLEPSSSALKVNLQSTNPLVTITKSDITVGVINSGQTINNGNEPFELSLSAIMPTNFTVNLIFTYTDGTYIDYDVIPFTFNPTRINVEENSVSTTITDGGRIGFDDPLGQSGGLGFAFNENQLLFEMGVLIGTNAGDVQSNVRGATSGELDQDFTVVDKIDQIVPGDRSSAEVFGKIKSSAAPSVEIGYRSMAWGAVPYDQFVIMEYTIRNTGNSAIENFHFGLFADWDISNSGAEDRASFFTDSLGQFSVGYVFPASAEASEFGVAGIQSLSSPAISLYYGIENNPSVATNTNSFGVYDGFTKQEKFRSLSSNKPQAGFTETDGTDVSHVVSTGPYLIAQGGEIKVAFAIHAAADTLELIESARWAHEMYNKTLVAPKPVVADINICYGDSTTITATGASSFNWYKEFIGGEPFFTGSSFTTNRLFSDTIFYVSNADNSFESVRTPARVFLKANPEIIPLGSTVICDGQELTLTVAEATSYSWSNGQTSRQIVVSGNGEFNVTVRDNQLGCESTSLPIVISRIPSPVADFTNTELVSKKPVNFTDRSTNARAWFWEFGNGATSTAQNPTFQYQSGGDIVVKLTVTAENGCSATISKSLNIVTSTKLPSEVLNLYPNPVSQVLYIEYGSAFKGEVQLDIISLVGNNVFSSPLRNGSSEGKFQIDVSSVPVGLYLLRLSDRFGNESTSKLLVSH